MPKKFEIRNSTAEFLIFQIEGKEQGVEVYYKDKTVWCTQKAMGMLFDCSTDNIGLHLKNIFASGELEKDSVTEKISATASDGKNYLTQFYNLDAVISVGYRVNSIRATQFRQWATSVLREYAIRGYVLDRKRMENGTFLGEDYFEHLLAEIREIRLSERRFYQKLTDIYATSMDYNKDAPTTRQFFKRIQNKMHYAVHGQTAAEIIYSRADAEKEFMGLTTFKGSRPHLSDAVIAKNYLNEKELRSLGQLVSGYLDFAERKAERHEFMTMADWAKHLDNVLTMNGEQLLVGSGSVSHKEAVEKATDEYKKYQQRTLSDVEKAYLDTIKMLGSKTEKKS